MQNMVDHCSGPLVGMLGGSGGDCVVLCNVVYAPHGQEVRERKRKGLGSHNHF